MAALSGAALATGCSDSDFDLGQPRSCEVGDQNEWVMGVMQDVYLFADAMPTVDPLDYDDPAALVADLRVDPDRWSRVSDAEATTALFEEGKFIGYGFRTKRDADGNVVVSKVHPESPAGRAGLRRGDTFRRVGGLTIAELDDTDAWSEVYGVKEPGVSVSLVVQDTSGERSVSLTKDWVQIVSVPIHDVFTVGDKRVGYLFFETFVGPALEELDDAFEAFNAAGVTDVVVDVRYNGGGLVSVSRHLTNLLVGGIADGAVSYHVEFNDELSDNDYARNVDSVAQTLPAVDTVVFITTGSSLSASELLINSVRAHTRVEIVGGTTGGKPVGSKHFSFCDSVLAPITFELTNADKTGGYFDGLDPSCAATDDLTAALGSEAEASLAAALSLIDGTGCPAITPEPADRDDPSKLELGQLELIGWH